MENKRKIGTEYEKKAGAYLESLGYKIICYNYRCYFGEIDIVAQLHDEIVFIEVKYRKNLSMGNPLEAVHVKKQKVISKCANYYMTTKSCYDKACRFDVIGIVGEEIIHIANAFDYQK